MVRTGFVAIGFLVCLSVAPGKSDDYDPLQIDAKSQIESLDFSVFDRNRDREIPIRVYFRAVEKDKPEEGKPESGSQPVILFSHGLGGSRTGSSFLGKHWANRGYLSVFVQHPGSDESVWKNASPNDRIAQLRSATSAKNYLARVQDISATLDQLEKWNSESRHPLANRMDLTRVGMSGHSFGGLTTQAISGQQFPLVRQKLADPRIRAAVVMSPSMPERGGVDRAFKSVEIPWLLMTGTHDEAAIGNQTPESRRQVFDALPAGNKFLLVLDQAEHSVFTERALPGDKKQRNPNHHRTILAISTAFWDAYLRNDSDAQAWLDGESPKIVLAPTDHWQKK